MIGMTQDGTAVAYVANGRLFLRRLAEADPQVLTGIEEVLALQGISDPVFSPEDRKSVV